MLTLAMSSWQFLAEITHEDSNPKLSWTIRIGWRQHLQVRLIFFHLLYGLVHTYIYIYIEIFQIIYIYIYIPDLRIFL